MISIISRVRSDNYLKWVCLPVLFGVLAFGGQGCTGLDQIVEIQAGSLAVGVSNDGRITSLVDTRTHRDYLPVGTNASILTFRIEGQDREPIAATFTENEGTLDLDYGAGLLASVRIQSHPTHASLELVAVSDPDAVDLAIWGPYPTTINRIIGETVGVVRGDEMAIGLQALNPRTLGGYPWNENDAMPQLDIFESGDYSDLTEEGKRGVLYRVEAAKPDSLGSTLQAYTRNRNSSRTISNWGHDRYIAVPFDDGGILGSRIALFGSPVDQALETIGSIEVVEGLPHPMIDGIWGKQAPGASAAYVIMPFSESSVDQAVDVTLQAGLRYLYHPEPFETWGDFQLGPDFPNGVEGLRGAVDQAHERGVMVGVHTLSNFITTNDPYVTPVPDPRLALVGASLLTRSVPSVGTDLEIDAPDFFGASRNDNLHAAVIGEEIIRYSTVSDGPPWILMDVERGAFGTRASAHEEGAAIGKLADHAYRVFLTNPELTIEMATNLADLFNATGLRQVSFDGLEGNRSTGMGNYGEILFTSTWFDRLTEDIRSHYIADASRTSHYFWHMYSRMNWGEPWYAGFRESQTEYRLKNQAYFRRNMMPGMLGWFRMQPETSVEDIEWMLARSAAFDAGYAFVTSFEALEGNGRSDEILRLIGMWEEARMAEAFNDEQKLLMEDIGNEFHLEDVEGGGWRMNRVYSNVFRFEHRERQPGEPEHQTFSIENLEAEQAPNFLLTPSGGSVDGVRLEIDGVHQIELPASLADGETLVFEGGEQATIYSSRWTRLRTVPVDASSWNLPSGSHDLVVETDMSGQGGAHLRVELRISGPAESVSR